MGNPLTVAPEGADPGVGGADTEGDETSHVVGRGTGAVFGWDYGSDRSGLGALYDRAKSNQWNGQTDLDWHTDVDQEAVVRANAVQFGGLRPPELDLSGTPLERWSDKEWLEFGIESQNWTMSQFLHGEQGALICAAKIVETVPWLEAKSFAATQVVDEARHVEVFSRYLRTKLSGRYPINAHLQMLLDDIVSDPRWDMTYLGMQIMVEGLGLAAFGFIRQMTTEPLLRQMLGYVMADESRHIAFGVLSLKDVYDDFSAAEIRERQEFVHEAAKRMSERFVHQEVWERMGVPASVGVPIIAQSPEHRAINDLLFAKVVPSCSKLGLLDAGDGWLRDRFAEMGVLKFEQV